VSKGYAKERRNMKWHVSHHPHQLE